MTTKRFEIFIDDNFHYHDDSYRYKDGEFDTYDEAVARCKKIVDESLAGLMTEAMPVDELIRSYAFFGDDPFIVPSEENLRFSARDYASLRCREICQ